ncbi:MAG: hypothetical protein H7X80_09350, partial [bacterium]|nr:hypothetical protein [Candidatus Kapabacteria bacterium]
IAPEVAVLGNDGGVYLSLDAGLSWQKHSAGLAITQFYRLGVDQTRPFRAYGGTQDNGTVGSFGTTSFSQSWTQVYGGDGFFVIMDENDPSWFYAEVYYGRMYRINATNPEIYTRVDLNIPDSGPNADVGNWATPLAMSPADKKSLYNGRSKLWRTTNRGGSWTGLTVGTGSKLTSIGLSPTDAKKIVVGFASGGIRYSVDYGVTWATGAGVTSSVCTDIKFDPVEPNRVYASFSGFGSAHIFRSNDNGATWVDISSNLPKIPFNAVEIDPNNNSHLFAASDVGAFFSPDGGSFWIPFNEGLPYAPISDLKIHKSSRMLIAATHGRSMFRIPIDNIAVAPALISPLGGERISTPGPLEISWFGFTNPVNVLISYASDEPFDGAAFAVAGDRVTIQLPLRQTTTARVRIVETGTGTTVTSGFFSLTATSNANPLGRRGFTAEAIEVRDSLLWATMRDTNLIYRLKIPLLTGGGDFIRTTVPGRIRDLAYYPTTDEFYALVTAADFSMPVIYRMDTSGASLGSLALPPELTSAVGIAMRGDALAVITSGPLPTIWLIDPTTGVEIERTSVELAPGIDRRSLVWNSRAYVQVVATDSAETGFGVELQQIAPTDPAAVFNRAPIVLAGGSAPRFFGLAHIPGLGDYFATDTTGIFYRLRGDILTAVHDETGAGSRATVSNVRVVPNPSVTSATLEFTIARSGDARIEIIDPTGVPVTDVTERRIDAGRHEIRLDVGPLASGLYFVVMQLGSERIVQPITVLR